MIEVALAALAAVVLHVAAARADNVDDLVKQLESSSQKPRLSAVVNLTKLGDPRAIPGLIRRLKVDGDKNVRALAASGLGTLVTASVKGKLRTDAEQALKDAAANDASASVQGQAQKALDAISASGPATAPQGGSGGVYVNIGPMSSKTGQAAVDAKMRALMEKTATKTMNKTASNMPTTWPGGGVPTAAALQKKGVQGFYIDGTLNELKVQTSGSTTTISCKISLLLAEFPSKNMFGFLNGAAKVQGSSSPKDIELAQEDCVTAVVEDLIAKKIVPTIQSKIGGSSSSASASGNP